MLVSRGLGVIKTANLLRRGTQLSKDALRNSSHASWNYRVSCPPASKGLITTAEIVGGVFWWWVVWHMVTEPGHVFGEFEYPNPNKWTDEELGIPPED